MSREDHKAEVGVVRRALLDLMQKAVSLEVEAQRLSMRMDSVTGGSMPDGHNGEQASFEMGFAVSAIYQFSHRLAKADELLYRYGEDI